MTCSERAVQDNIRRYVLQRGGGCIKLHGNAVQGKTTLDLIGGLDGVPFVCEVKAPGKKPTKYQTYMLQKYASWGFAALWADSLEMFKTKWVELVRQHNKV
jgi:hypothetical protein